MKKRYLVFTIFLIFLLFLPFTFGAVPDKWVECKNFCSFSINKCEGTGDACCIAGEQDSVTSKFCCNNIGVYGWQDTVCETCIDEIKNQDETGVDCGGVCVTSDTEICNGVDDDKDCSVDEGLSPTLCLEQDGVCSGSVKTCGGTSGLLACAADEFGLNYESTENTCNDGLDNDCDGLTDCADSDCSADANANCCLLATDQTSGSWTWTPPNHEDAGIDYSTNLFNSAASPCSALSGGSCFDANNNPVNHKSALTTGACCGNDASEFYKPDYYGGECTNNINDCVWSTGDTQQSDTGNAAWWCFLHEWNECKDSTIGTKVGGVTCAGIVGNNAWTTNSQLLGENQYSCTDNLDNDGDGSIDCADSDCSADANANCCLLATDQTSGSWTWTPPNHEDAGKGFSSDLFNSDTAACPDSSCSDPTPGACACFDSIGSPINHKGTFGSATCCGDDANEFYKPDYYGPECTNNVNDCVWSDGNAQASGTGNKEYWCFEHEWNVCLEGDPDTVTIGTKVGGVTCAGIAGSQKWTIDDDLLPENQYSCTDGLDNDGDTFIDCADVDCAGSITGNVQDTENNNIQGARIDVIKGATVEHTASTDASGDYQTTDPVLCGDYNIIASKDSYVSSTKTITLPPQTSMTVDFTGSDALVLGTSCEDDCTYAGDNTVHQECDGINGCGFFDATAKQVCNLAQPGWIRDYSETQEIECAEGTPRDKVQVKATVTCDEENLIKLTKVVTYKGKLVKLHVVVCG